jgi:hypothetical protein
MTGIKRRLRSLEEKLGINKEPTIITIHRETLGEKTVHITRIKYNPDGTVEHLGEEVREWHSEELNQAS